MKTDLNKWLQHNYEISSGLFPSQMVRNNLTCNDGTTLSIQASRGHYCSPRDSFVNEDTGEITLFDYGQVEVWCVSCNVPESWLDYGNQETDPYAYIPVQMVEEFIDLHGGIEDYS